jgi:hypothetical protein
MNVIVFITRKELLKKVKSAKIDMTHFHKLSENNIRKWLLKIIRETTNFYEEKTCMEDGIINHCGDVIHPLTGDRLHLKFDNDNLSFKTYNWRNKTYHDLDTEKYTSAYKFKIQIPSKKLLISNYLDIPDRKRDISINYIRGIFDTTEYLESINVGYGQTTNTTIYVYSNETDILILEYYDSDRKLQSYLKKNKFIEMGQISCGIWRYECCDYEQYKSDDVGEVIIDIMGSRIECEHYMNSLVTSPISKNIVAHFKILL